ncbi:unnamed protein product, partial [Larinioides sclopetarius]
VRGSYGYTDAQGLFRKVQYSAGPAGFSATVNTNEPGVDGKENPADVVMNVQKTPAGIQERYTRPARGGWSSGNVGGFGGMSSGSYGGISSRGLGGMGGISSGNFGGSSSGGYGMMGGIGSGGFSGISRSGMGVRSGKSGY